ncbi:MAG: GFA family protein [Myxococcota bacterium]|nr:GFA family protein [Myxococcota bacterium]
MPDKHTGSCHCGKVRFEVEGKFDRAISCNCSICRRRGTMLTFVPADQFTLLAGEDALTDYQFGKKVIHHVFCSTCGTASFARGAAPDGTKMCAVNVRCLDDVDLDEVQVKQFDGRSR